MPIIGGALALWAIGSGWSAQAQQASAAKCLSTPQVEALTRVALPTTFRTLAEKCAASLPAQAYLTRNAATLALKFEPMARASVVEAHSAIVALSGDPMVALIPPQSIFTGILKPLVSSYLKDLSASDCRSIDAGISALAPLPPANFAKFAAVLITAAGNRPNPRMSIRFCEAPFQASNR